MNTSDAARRLVRHASASPPSSLLATLCIVLADGVHNRPAAAATEGDLREILARIREIKHKIGA